MRFKTISHVFDVIYPQLIEGPENEIMNYL